MRSGSATALILLLGLAGPAAAAEPAYLGKWKIESAVAGPWAEQKPDPKEARALIGKTITLEPKAISGPRPFPCRKPSYRMTDYGADMLFQGAFGEMQARDKTNDPLRLAASVGFSGSSWKTLETGCEIDWHFADPLTVKIGLDNMVFTLRKQPN